MAETMLALTLRREVAEDLLAIDPPIAFKAPGVRGDPGPLVDGLVLGSSLAANTVTLLVAGKHVGGFAKRLARVARRRGDATVELKGAHQPEVEVLAGESELISLLRAMLAAIETADTPAEEADGHAEEPGAG